MPKKPQGITLAPLDDIFSVDTPTNGNAVHFIDAPLEDIHAFKNHPYKVRDDQSMWELVDSIKENGVLYPALVRPRPAGGYEMIAGHRRKRACVLAGLSTIPILIRDVDDDTATILMVQSNCQREELLPSEKAQAYRMMMDAIRRQGSRTDLTLALIGPKSKAIAADAIAQKVGESRNQIKRYVRLSYLTPRCLDMVDNGLIPLYAGVDLSNLGETEQQWVSDALAKRSMRLTMAQASSLKAKFQDGVLTKEIIAEIFTENHPNVVKVSLSNSILKRYFPPEYNAKQMQSVILDLLEEWMTSQKDTSESR